MTEEQYYEILKEAYVDYSNNLPRLRVYHMNNHTFHEFVWASFQQLRILDQLEDEYGDAE